MTRRITLALAAVCALLAGGLPLPAACPGDAAAVPAVGARHPALSPDARLLAFDWRGDIWMVPAEGGAARRLTDHVAHESFPRWSPDGREIAFSGDRHGADDIFVVGLDGGAPERLTFHSDWDRIYDWSAD
ncbi:MAG: PD40 domain-containing protein, partial [Candidatus Krumholzibacteriota bacterium]|nr:PD40 domain-containing protein [Candidatus Krumholzibacteriota bacterium]